SDTTHSMTPLPCAAVPSPITRYVRPSSDAPGVPASSKYSSLSVPGWSMRISLILGSPGSAEAVPLARARTASRPTTTRATRMGTSGAADRAGRASGLRSAAINVRERGLGVIAAEEATEPAANDRVLPQSQRCLDARLEAPRLAVWFPDRRPRRE